jgi:flavin reductase (DIM6/NTAB) family NADH-FMN oxidoreductase RutF
MEYDLRTTDLYPLLTGVVTPRPIAWVSTVSAAGVVNLAPFSYFNVFGHAPPIVAFSPNLNADGSPKDTLRNLRDIGEFVVNASVAKLADAVNVSATPLPFGESEVTLAGLTTMPSTVVKPPRIAESPAHLECKVLEIKSYGSHGGAPNLVIGEVVALHIADGVLTDGLPDPHKLQTLGRLAGLYWCDSSRGLFEMQRPT